MGNGFPEHFLAGIFVVAELQTVTAAKRFPYILRVSAAAKAVGLIIYEHRFAVFIENHAVDDSLNKHFFACIQLFLFLILGEKRRGIIKEKTLLPIYMLQIGRAHV